jgi:hypothetical protein
LDCHGRYYHRPLQIATSYLYISIFSRHRFPFSHSSHDFSLSPGNLPRSERSAEMGLTRPPCGRAMTGGCAARVTIFVHLLVVMRRQTISLELFFGGEISRSGRFWYSTDLKNRRLMKSADTTAIAGGTPMQLTERGNRLPLPISGRGLGGSVRSPLRLALCQPPPCLGELLSHGIRGGAAGTVSSEAKPPSAAKGPPASCLWLDLECLLRAVEADVELHEEVHLPE